MKNVTVALDDETHRKARIRAAELGTSLSALVKDYLTRLAEKGDVPVVGVRDMQMPYMPQPAGPEQVPAKQVFTKDGKPRQPGALRGKIHMADDWDEWPEGLLEAMEGQDNYKPWFK